MVSFSDVALVPATSVPTGVSLPIQGAFLLPAAGGRPACAPSMSSGLHTAQGTGVSGFSRTAHAEQAVSAQVTTRKPDNYMTRVDAIGGGGPGPYPAREPV